jgi:phosphoenolpyruvate synthase/pyruvate phosphate dikinase
MTQQRKLSLVISLDEVGKEGGDIAGRKGAYLGEMRQAGVDIPPGLIVTTKSYRALMTERSLTAGPEPSRLRYTRELP